MHRNNLKKLLFNYIPKENELLTKARILDFVEKNPNCFETSNPIGHITGSSWLVNKNRDKVLLLHHAKLNIWVQPGGHADGESDILAVALREAQEESGIIAIEAVSDKIFDIDIHTIPTYKDVKEHLHFDIRFLLRVTDDSLAKKSVESNELGWFDMSLDKLPTNEPSVLRMLNKWMQYKY